MFTRVKIKYIIKTQPHEVVFILNILRVKIK